MAGEQMPAAAADLVPQVGRAHAGEQGGADRRRHFGVLQVGRVALDDDARGEGADELLIDLAELAVAGGGVELEGHGPRLEIVQGFAQRMEALGIAVEFAPQLEQGDAVAGDFQVAVLGARELKDQMAQAHGQIGQIAVHLGHVLGIGDEEGGDGGFQGLVVGVAETGQFEGEPGALKDAGQGQGLIAVAVTAHRMIPPPRHSPAR